MRASSSFALLLALPLALAAQGRTGGRGGAGPSAAQNDSGGLPSSALSAFRFRAIGPATYSGRVGDIAVAPD
jgi:hypothetical protein